MIIGLSAYRSNDKETAAYLDRVLHREVVASPPLSVTLDSKLCTVDEYKCHIYTMKISFQVDIDKMRFALIKPPRFVNGFASSTLVVSDLSVVIQAMDLWQNN